MQVEMSQEFDRPPDVVFRSLVVQAVDPSFMERSLRNMRSLIEAET